MSETRFGSKMLDVKQPEVRRWEYENSPEGIKEAEDCRKRELLIQWQKRHQWIKDNNGKIKTKMTNQEYYYVKQKYDISVFYEFKNLKDCKRFIKEEERIDSMVGYSKSYFEIFRKNDLEKLLVGEFE